MAEPENLGGGTESEGGVFDEDEGYPLRRRTTPRPALFEDQPDLTPLIDTNFDSQPPSHLLLTPPRDGFDFGGLVEKAYLEHEPPSPGLTASYPSSSPLSGPPPQRRRSLGYIQPPAPQGQGTPDWESAVWAMELRGNLIAAGRSSGKLEVRPNPKSTPPSPYTVTRHFMMLPCRTERNQWMRWKARGKRGGSHNEQAGNNICQRRDSQSRRNWHGESQGKCTNVLCG